VPDFRIKNTIAALAVMATAGWAGAASAATVTFSEMPRIIGTPYTFSYNDLDVTVRGWNYTHTGTVGAQVTPTSESDIVVNNQGLGVCDNVAGTGKQCGSTLIDAESSGGPEIAVFTFSKAVTISAISFNQNNKGEQVDFLTSAGSFPLTYRGTQTFAGGGPNSDTFTLSLGSLQQLGVGVFGSSNKADQVRISGFTFACDGLTDCTDDDTVPSPVPLPAGLPMLASALGLGVFLRKRHARA
jgi:hypothetical protein